MNDLELRTRLTADASGLVDALRTAEQGTDAYVRGIQQAGAAAKVAGTAEREAAASVDSAAAAQKAFLALLRDQVATYRMSTEQVLTFRAAQAGVAQEAMPWIRQLQSMREAQEAAAAAARDEAAAQREAAQARKSAEAAQQAFLAGLRDQVELQGKSTADTMRYRAEQLGVGPEAAQHIARYEQAMAKTGVTAGQTAAAMRMLPAQITDVTTSLASGMPVWLVAIQQGGQIKDSFGGIGPMFEALAGSITPARVGIGLAAASVGALVVAYMQAQQESEGYNRAILLSGNAAGTTAGRLNEMAKAVDAVVGTQHEAAQTLAMLTATGEVAARNLATFATTAEQMQRAFDIAVADTVKNFEDLGRAPLEKTLALNQAYNYLTTSTYERIKALTEQRRLDEAAEVAQKAYSDAMAERSRRVEEQLGTLQRASRATTGFFKEMWDAILNVGRPETTEEAYAKVQKQLQELDAAEAHQRRVNNGQVPEGTAKGMELRRQALIAQRDNLQEQLRLQGRSAAADAEDRARVNRAIEADKQADEQRSAIAGAAIARIKDQLNGLTGAYADADRIVEQQHQAALVDDRTYWEAKRELIAANAQVQISALEAENAVLARQKVFGSERIQRDQQMASNQAEMARLRAKAAADTVIANAQEEAGYRKLQLALQEYSKQLSEVEAARGRAQQRTLETLGRGDEARGLAERQNQVDDRYLQQRSQLESDRAASRLTQSEFQTRLALLDDYHQRALEAEVTYQQQIQLAQQDGSLGMQRALENYADKARNVAAQTEGLFSNAFTSAEDAVVKFAMTAKINFHSFAEAVIADLIRIYVRQQLVGIFGQVTGMLTGGGSGGSSGSVDWANVPAEVAHGGGVVGTDNLTRRMARADAWSGAPRYHGGLKSDEFRAILQRGESVLTPAQMRQLAPVGTAATSAPVNVNVPINLVNNSGTPLRASSQRRQDGGFDVILEAVESALAANVAQGSGPMARAMEGRYGLQPSMNT